MKTFTLTKTHYKRIFAFVVDYILFYIPNFWFSMLFSFYFVVFFLLDFFRPCPEVGLFPIYFILFFLIPWIIFPILLLHIFSLSLANIAVTLSYLIIYCLVCTCSLFLFEFFFQRTIGKFITRFKVCNLDGSRISFFKSFARNFIKFFFFATLPLLILPYWGGGTQGLHDKICRTKVIDAPKYSKKMHILQYVVVMIIIIIFLLAVYWFVDAVWLDLPFL